MTEESLNVEQTVRDVEPHLEKQQLLQSLSLRDDLLHNLEQKLGQWETVIKVKETNMETKEKLLERLGKDNERLKIENKEKTKMIKNLEDAIDKQAEERKNIVEEVKKLVVVLEQEYSEDTEGTKTNDSLSLHKDISVKDKEISKLRFTLDNTREAIKQLELNLEGNFNSLQEKLDNQADDVNKQTENMQEMFRGTKSELQNALRKIEETEDEKKRLEDECNTLKGMLEDIKTQNLTEIHSLREELRKKNDELTSTYDQPESNVGRLVEESNEKMLGRVAELEREKINLQQELDSVRSDLHTSQLENMKTVKSLQEMLDNQADDVSKQTENIQDKVNRTQSELQNALHKIEETEDEKKCLEDECNTLKKMLEDIKTQNVTEIQSLREELRKKNGELTSTFDLPESNVGRLDEESNEKMLGRVAELERENINLQQELDSVRSDLHTSQLENVNTVKSLQEMLDNQACDVSKQTENIHGKVHRTQSELQNALHKIEDTEDEKKRLEDECNTKELEENNDQLTSSLEESETRIEELTPKLDKAGQERQPHDSDWTGSVTKVATQIGDTLKINENSTIPKEDEVRQTTESLRLHNEKNQRIIDDKDSKIKETQQKLDSVLEANKKLDADNSTIQTELKNAKSSIDNLSSENKVLQQKITDQQSKLCSNGVKMQETLNKLAVREGELKRMETQHNECTKKWIQDRTRTDEAVEQKQRAEAEFRKRKAIVLWKLAIRLTVEQQSKIRMRGHLLLSVSEISGEIVELKEHITSLDQEHQETLRNIRDENSHLKEDLQGAQEETRTISAHLTAAQEETGTLTAHYTEMIQETVVEKKNLQDQITRYSFMLEQQKGEVAIAHGWVNKMSEQCAQSEANKNLLSRQLSISEGLLQEKEQQCQELRGEVAERECQMEHLRNEMHILEDRQRFFDDRIQHASAETIEQRRIVAALKDEIDKAERALRQAYRQDEERVNELKKKEEEKQRLIRDVLNLRRQLNSMRVENDHLRGNCNQLRAELLGYLNVR